MIVTPSFTYERGYWDSGIGLIAGIDEVGMGALAGPVVAAAVIWQADAMVEQTIRDSKLLSAKQRAVSAVSIKQQAQAWAIGEASVEEIYRLNIRQASHLAMRRAIEALPFSPELVLIDGNPVQPHPTIPAVNLIKGDRLSYSIAAASIVAKVYRDDLMMQLDGQYPGYGFAQHKGYGTVEHLAGLERYGPCAVHRQDYAPVARLTKVVAAR